MISLMFTLVDFGTGLLELWFGVGAIAKTTF